MTDRLQQFDANPSGRDFFVGDLHGCYDLLMDRLRALDFDPDVDRVFSVGDLVDRGPDSRRCLELIREPWFHAVLGNHEAMMADALNGGDPTLWIMNGGDWFYRDENSGWRDTARELLASLPLALEVALGEQRVGVIHADVTSGRWGEFREDEDIWSRTRIVAGGLEPVAGIDRVVVGHSILPEVIRLDNVVYLDTGAFQSGRLRVIEASELLTIRKSTA